MFNVCSAERIKNQGLVVVPADDSWCLRSFNFTVSDRAVRLSFTRLTNKAQAQVIIRLLWNPAGRTNNIIYLFSDSQLKMNKKE